MQNLDREFQRRARFDLWIHQNGLFWSRFQLLYFLQTGYFLLVASLGRTEPRMLHNVLFVTIALMTWLYSTLNQDRKLRNLHGRLLKVHHKFDVLPAEATGATWLPQAFWEHTFQVSVFLAFVIADIIAADHFAPFCGGNFRLNSVAECGIALWHHHF